MLLIPAAEAGAAILEVQVGQALVLVAEMVAGALLMGLLLLLIQVAGAVDQFPVVALDHKPAAMVDQVS
jgi:hypothetical protein